MKNKKKKSKAEPSALGALKASLLGLCVFALSALALSFLAAFLAYRTADPGANALYFGLALLYLSSAAAGFAAYKAHGGLPLLTGLFCGAICAALTLVVSLFMAESGSASLLVISRLSMIPMSVIGALVASVKRKRRKKRR